MSNLRLFFAIDLPPVVRQAVDSWRQSRQFPGRPEPAANLHITLVFLGSYPASSLDALRDVVASTQLTAFDLQLDRIRRWRNGILHLAPAQVPLELSQLEHGLHHGAASVGLKLDTRRFSPHLTLARECPPFRFPRCPEFKWTVDRLTLFSSERDREGTLVYRPVLDWDMPPAARSDEQQHSQAESA